MKQIYADDKQDQLLGLLWMNCQAELDWHYQKVSNGEGTSREALANYPPLRHTHWDKQTNKGVVYWIPNFKDQESKTLQKKQNTY